MTYDPHLVSPFHRRQQEHIVAAAVRLKIDNRTYSLLPPARHGEVIALVHSIYRDRDDLPKNSAFVQPDEQGFVTSYGRFVNREEGKLIAYNARQLNFRASPLSDLFSEDMW